MKSITTDYLIIGGGAMGVAFADEMLTQDASCHLTIVDRRSRLGGHWVDSYPFVRLHQPAAFYGVNSMVLGNGSTDLSSKTEILAYYDRVLERFESSGRVTFLSGHNYIGHHQVTPIQDPTNIIDIQVHQRIVDATYMDVQVPSTHAPKFPIDSSVPVVPLNDLVEEHTKWERFYVLGNGKTGMDAVLYLLDNGVDADRIHWIAPSGIWCFNRDTIQIGSVTRNILAHGDHLIKRWSPTQVFEQLESTGSMLRLDPKVTPTKWRCATMDPREMHLLRSVKNIIRKGRVKSITPTTVHLEHGDIDYPQGALFVNCTASGLAQRAAKPVFAPGSITLQSLFFCQQVFSAAAIARLETKNISDQARNAIRVVPHPEFVDDWPILYSRTIDNLLLLHQHLPLWMFRSRLNFLSFEPLLKYIGYGLKAARLSSRLRKVSAEYQEKRKRGVL